jgi:signal transduction histidine kinase
MPSNLTDPSPNATLAEWQAAYAELRAACLALEDRTEKRLALLKQQIAQRREAEEALQRESNTLRLLQEVAVAANQAQSVEDLLQFALDKICDYMQWPVGHVYIRTQTNDGEMVSAGLWHCIDERYNFLHEATAAAHKSQADWLSQALNQLRPGWLDLAQNPLFTQAETETAVTGRFVIPILVGDEIAALLEFFASETADLDEGLLNVLEHIALQLGRVVKRTQAEEALQESRRWLRHLAGWVVNAQEEERQRVSQELHDEAGQALTALKISLELIEASLPGELTAVRDSLNDAIELTDETMEGIRLLAHNLRPPVLDRFGLDASLEGLCRDFAERIQLPISYQGTTLPPLPDDLATSLYRFVQEGLTNAAKHANATQVEVNLSCEDGRLRLLVADNGRGFHVRRQRQQIPQGSGMGLMGMVERLMLLGGQLDIDSKPGEGTRLTAVVPFTEESKQTAGIA